MTADTKNVAKSLEESDEVASPWTHFIVRTSDVTLAVLLLAVTLPILLAVSIFIVVTDGFPILFRQARSGLREKSFRILKFRTLTDRGEGGLSPIPGGRWLRRSSLDELPQLVNILVGDMSFVGPRPLLPDYSDFYTTDERIRFKVRPGLTGSAQTSQLNGTDWDKKLSADVDFVRSYSLRSYLRILVATPRAMLRRMRSRRDWDTEKRLDVVRSSNAPRQLH